MSLKKTRGKNAFATFLKRRNRCDYLWRFQNVFSNVMYENVILFSDVFTNVMYENVILFSDVL